MASKAAVSTRAEKLPCAHCGAEVNASERAAVGALPPASGELWLDDLAAALWVQAYDAAWLGKDWDSLGKRFVPDVKFVAPTLAEPLIGRDAVLAYLREAMSRVMVHEYNATDLKGYDCGSSGVITYRWQLECTVGQERTQSTGRDALVLQAAGNQWLLAWRGQFRAG